MIKSARDISDFETNAAEVSAILRAVANERRLMILCRLVEWGEGNAGALAEAVGVSQSALSQHLAVLREHGMVAYRRDSQTLWYRIADPRIEALFATLHHLFCRRPAGGASGRPSDAGFIGDQDQ